MKTAFVQGLKTDDILKDYKPSLWSKFKRWLEDNWPFNSWNHVTSFEDYQKLSYSDKTVWGLFYRYHSVNINDDWLHNYGSDEYKKEDELIETYKKFRWPVQYWIRETLRIRWWGRYLEDFWYAQINCRFDPKQKWLTKVIPRTWCDKTGLIVDVNFAMVIDFVEGEDYFNTIDTDASSSGHQKFAKELHQCYDYIKVYRAKIQKAHDESYPKVFTNNFKKDYAENHRLEKLLNDSDTKWLVWIVKNRDYFWT